MAKKKQEQEVSQVLKNCTVKLGEFDNIGHYETVEFICPITDEMRMEYGYPKNVKAIKSTVTVYPVMEIVDEEIRSD